MNHSNSVLAFILVFAFTSVGCLKTRAELRGEEDDSGPTMQKQTNAAQVREREAKPLPPPPKVDEVDEQMRQLSGRVDTAESRVNQLITQRELEKDMNSKKLLAYEEAIKKLEDEVRALNDEVSRLKAPPVAAVVSNGKGGEKANYFEEAEAQFAAKKWKDGIVLYQKYRDSAPKGKMFLEATYKIGLCFQELGMKDESRSFFEEVIAKAPKSKEAKKAQFRMKSLK